MVPRRDSTALTVLARDELAEDVVGLTLADPDGARLPDWTPGAHIDLELPNGMTRQYSLCGDRWDPFRYRVAVLREAEGRGGSAYLHEHLRAGDLVGLGGPRNNFPLVPSPRYLFVAGGIGITPILPMVHQAQLLGADWTLLYGGRRRASMAFLDRLAEYGDRVRVVPQEEHGLLDLATGLADPSDEVKVYCCGPAPLLAAVEQACLPWPRHALRTERFVAREQPAPRRATSFEVRLAASGTTVTVAPGISVLDAVRAAGVDVLSSCRQGTCGTCEIGVLEGVPDHRDSILDDEQRARGDCLFPCVSRSLSDRLVLDV
ncbi:PDR/VanB family oxidoreductase [Pseudonocardia spinosispora]|uniref:PDR/VanB family oxidoreductase n=1 Tax=Pseudonocardia spinosispora TaxID=103441 RepID=UPI001FE11259|nr:PDR/VanB family oxidoreductase [Pseudonocardia spinosispora]